MSDGLLSNEERASVVEYVVKKRTASFDYMKRAYEGEMHWMSTVKIPTSGLVAYYSHKDMAKRVQEWFCLGVSLAEIVKMPNSDPNFIRALSQLMEEYSYYSGGSASGALKVIKSVIASSDKGAGEEAIKPQLKQSGGTIVYQYLKTPTTPFSLYYREVVVSLCDILGLTYRKFLNSNAGHPVYCEAILKLDVKFKHYVISLMSRDLNNLARVMYRKSVSTLMSTEAS